MTAEYIVNSKNEIIRKLRSSVQLYRELGFEYLPFREDQIARLTGRIHQKIVPMQDDKICVQEKIETGRNNPGNALKLIREEIGDCQRCKLCSGRRNIVFGEGSPNASLMFIGEGPGRDEDVQGRPFVGEAGKLLTNLIIKLGMKREDVYIGNIVKCRPPNNRNPEKDEIAACIGFIRKQIEAVSPKVIVCLGRISSQALLETTVAISQLRGEFMTCNNIPVMPTFHPAYLLRNKKDKWKTWDDMQKVVARLQDTT